MCPLPPISSQHRPKIFHLSKSSSLALHVLFNVAREISWPEEPHASSHISLVLALLLLIVAIKPAPLLTAADLAGTHSAGGVAGGVAGPSSALLFNMKTFVARGLTVGKAI